MKDYVEHIFHVTALFLLKSQLVKKNASRVSEMALEKG